MTYKQKTPHLGIPVVGNRDRISPDVEMRKYTIIENMLIAGTQGLTEVVFDDGTYTLSADGNEFKVKVTAGGTFPSMHGIVQGFYFKAQPSVSWEGLKNGYFYYLYVKATPKTPYEHSSIRLTASSVQLGKGALLMATVDLREETPRLNTEPEDKVYSQDVARHASDKYNPHGRRLEQDELIIRKDLVIAAGAIVDIDGEVFQGAEFAVAAAALVGRKVEVIDFVSGGPKGVLLKASGKVVCAQVQRRVTSSVDTFTGELGVGYFGEDDSADSALEFKVYNNGEEGVPMRAFVICG